MKFSKSSGLAPKHPKFGMPPPLNDPGRLECRKLDKMNGKSLRGGSCRFNNPIIIYIIFSLFGGLAHGESPKFDPYAAIIDYIEKFEVEEAWIWVDIYSDKNPNKDAYSPRKIVTIPKKHIVDAQNLFKEVSSKVNSKNFNGEFEIYALVFKSKNGSSFGLLNDPSTEGGLFQFVLVNLDDKPFISGHVSIVDISNAKNQYNLNVTGVYLPKYANSEILKLVNSATEK